MQKEKIKRDLLAVVAVVLTVLAVTIFLLTFKSKMTNLLSEMTLQSISEMQELYAESLRTKFKDQFKTLEAQVAYFYNTDISNTEEVKKKATFALEIGDFKRIAVVNKDGVGIDLSGKTLPNMKNKSYFFNAILQNEIQFADQIELDDNLNPCLTITYPFKNAYDENGVIAGFFSYEALKKIFSIPIFSGQSYFYLIANDGNIILCNKDRSSNLYNVDFYDYLRRASGNENSNSAKLKIDMAKNQSGHLTFDGTEGKKLFVYAPLKINGWYIISVLPYTYIENQQTRISKLVYILLFSIALVLVMFISIIYVVVKKTLAIKRDNERLTIASNQAQSLIFEYDTQKQKVDFSGDTHFILGTDKRTFDINFIRAEYLTRIHPEDENILEHLRNSIKTGKGTFSAEFRFKSFNGSYFWVKMTGSSIFDEGGRLGQFIGSITNVNSQVLHEQELRNIADRDRLSYLMNKSAFEREARSYLFSEGAGKFSALFMIDLDNFKDVNDNLGHMTGDLAIKDAAKKISLIFSDRDILGRFGGDEFCVLMCFNEVLTKESIMKIVNVKAADLVRSLKEVYQCDEKKVQVSASIGIAVYPENGTTYEELFKSADATLYDVKQHGKDGFKICEQL